MLVCPICREKLVKEKHCFTCVNGHSFDVAKQGYVNMSRKQKKLQGDNVEMVHARTAFLEKGYYDFMRQFVRHKIEELGIHRLVDTGCGQGYYTGLFSQSVDSCIGMDMSKSAIKYAAGHDKKSMYLVSSIFSMPIADGSVDGVTSLFVPEATSEVHRILEEDGYWIVVGPGKRHCWELKEVLYDEVYENKVEIKEKKGFECISVDTISDCRVVDGVWDLLEMTPYRYRSPQKGLDKVRVLDSLEVTFEFVIEVWRKVCEQK